MNVKHAKLLLTSFKLNPSRLIPSKSLILTPSMNSIVNIRLVDLFQITFGT